MSEGCWPAEQWQTSAAEAGKRLDAEAAAKTGKSRSYIQAIIREEKVIVNGSVKKANYVLREGDVVAIRLPEPKELTAEPEAIPLTVVYEDEDLLVVDKPQGMVVHPAPGSWTGTLVNALLHHCRDLSGINGVLRPGIVHRIDKDTSGLLVVAKNDEAHRSLAEQIKEHSMTRVYRAILRGVMTEPSGTVEAPIGRDTKDRKKMAVVLQNAKPAMTHYYVLQRYERHTEIQAVLATGRTHQIRVHMEYIGHPVLGDPLYGPKRCEFGLNGQALHAEVLGFCHPRTGAYCEFTAAVPPYFEEVIHRLGGDARCSFLPLQKSKKGGQ